MARRGDHFSLMVAALTIDNFRIGEMVLDKVSPE